MEPLLYDLFLQGCRWFIQIHLVTKVLVQISVLNLPLWSVGALASEMMSFTEVRLLAHCASGISMA